MEYNFRKFVASSELFQGYTTMIDLNKCDTLDDIINIFVSRLHLTLVENNFIHLINRFHGCNFHIHGFSINDIILSKSDTVFYLCDHC